MESHDKEKTSASSADPLCSESSTRHHWKSEEIFQGLQEVLILHRDETYRLRQTRQGKLLLQK